MKDKGLENKLANKSQNLESNAYLTKKSKSIAGELAKINVVTNGKYIRIKKS